MNPSQHDCQTVIIIFEQRGDLAQCCVEAATWKENQMFLFTLALGACVLLVLRGVLASLFSGMRFYLAYHSALAAGLLGAVALALVGSGGMAAFLCINAVWCAWMVSVFEWRQQQITRLRNWEPERWNTWVARFECAGRLARLLLYPIRPKPQRILP